MALEEIGASIDAVVRHFAYGSDPDLRKFADARLVDKRFLAIWEPLMDSDKITKKQAETLSGVLLRIRDSGMQGLCADADEKDPHRPTRIATESEALELINSASEVLEKERGRVIGKIDTERLEAVLWLSAAVADKGKTEFILGNDSLEKLSELGTMGEWIAWLKCGLDGKTGEKVQERTIEVSRKASKGRGITESRFFQLSLFLPLVLWCLFLLIFSVAYKEGADFIMSNLYNAYRVFVPYLIFSVGVWKLARNKPYRLLVPLAAVVPVAWGVFFTIFYMVISYVRERTIETWYVLCIMAFWATLVAYLVEAIPLLILMIFRDDFSPEGEKLTGTKPQD